ncbi:DNA cytosine methyltransferase [Helicobacter suis]|uniref:DNA (cytosine-5-)-methyltransferase n=2 Tax=Helicobacter suis TaxID=104628 RepID=E7G3H1_9HELI|nr:putative cytosine-specific DNA methyltransferase (DDEM) [Helicobacter suis HS5]BCD45538.1 hypothetical protein NHP190020_05770 [Helicobacter suis]BDR27719.1 hypothetical protein HSHS1_04800 [Helicobacter suis HS1]BCD47192.1 hypothetical protein NHP194003_03960 [Helicobacter suis]BCD48947.1 hypothetical protein NHP194004_03940 [Helicobacter suis]
MIQFKLADIFCGAGGLSYGFAQNALFDLVWALDYDLDALASYKSNHPTTNTICRDIVQLSREECLGYGPIDILLGGPSARAILFLEKDEWIRGLICSKNI